MGERPRGTLSAPLRHAGARRRARGADARQPRRAQPRVDARAVASLPAYAAYRSAMPPACRSRIWRPRATTTCSRAMPLASTSGAPRTTIRWPRHGPPSSWLRSTGLRPFLDRLDAAQQASFLDDYERRIDAAYPARSDGLRLLSFRVSSSWRRGAPERMADLRAHRPRRLPVRYRRRVAPRCRSATTTPASRRA